MSKARLQVREKLILSKYLNKKHIDRDFYFDKIEEGLYMHKMDIKHTLMFKNGSGSELIDKENEKAKARAIDSSSMLSYNFFSGVSENSPLEIGGIEYVSVYFEVKLKTLVTSNAPANIDVVLVDRTRKKVLFIESKFLEYTEIKKCEISASYSDITKYFKTNKYKDQLIGLANIYRGKSRAYYEGIKQNICHLVAVTSLECEDARLYAKRNNVEEIEDIFDNGVKYQFVNLLFDPAPNLNLANDKYKQYIDLLYDFESKLGELKAFLMNGKIVLSYSKLYRIINGLNSYSDRCAYLNNRYMFCSNI